jgi:hypothetical protein
MNPVMSVALRLSLRSLGCGTASTEVHAWGGLRFATADKTDMPTGGPARMANSAKEQDVYICGPTRSTRSWPRPARTA